MRPDVRNSFAFWKVPSLRLFVLLVRATWIDETNVDHWWNGTDRRKTKYLEKNLARYHFIHHRSHMDCPGMEAESPQLKVKLISVTFNTPAKLRLPR